MSSSIKKVATGKLNQGETKSKKPALGFQRYISIAKGIHDACGLPMMLNVEHLGVPPLPPWALRICEQLGLTIFKRFLELNPDEKPVEWRNYGRIIGVGLRELKLIESEIEENSDEDGEEGEILDELLDSILKGSHADALFAHFGRSLDNWLRIGFGQGPAEQHEFLTGLAEGQTLFLDTQGHFTGDRGRTKLYFALLSNWPEIEAMRGTHPPKTHRDIYELIAPSLGDTHLLRFEWFLDACKKIKLQVGVPGRPRNY